MRVRSWLHAHAPCILVGCTERSVGMQWCDGARYIVWRMDMMSCAMRASRPEVGSSTRRTDGWESSSTPIETRLRWPPERPRRLT